MRSGRITPSDAPLIVLSRRSHSIEGTTSGSTKDRLRDQVAGGSHSPAWIVSWWIRIDSGRLSLRAVP